jgi:hypothetical protein
LKGYGDLALYRKQVSSKSSTAISPARPNALA